MAEEIRSCICGKRAPCDGPRHPAHPAYAFTEAEWQEMAQRPSPLDEVCDEFRHLNLGPRLAEGVLG